MAMRLRDIAKEPGAARRPMGWFEVLYLAIVFYSWPLIGAAAAGCYAGFNRQPMMVAMLVGAGVGCVLAVALTTVARRSLDVCTLSSIGLLIMAPTGGVAVAAGAIIGWLAPTLLLWIPAAVCITYLAFAAYAARHARRFVFDHRCPICGYPLEDLSGQPCAECGQDFQYINRAASVAIRACLSCGYPLEGLKGDICPECGARTRPWM